MVVCQIAGHDTVGTITHYIHCGNAFSFTKGSATTTELASRAARQPERGVIRVDGFPAPLSPVSGEDVMKDRISDNKGTRLQTAIPEGGDTSPEVKRGGKQVLRCTGRKTAHAN
jgi:hypothetical protein